VADRAQVRAFSGHTDWVYCLAVNEATKRLATGSFDGEVRVWNLDDGKAVATFKAAPGLQPAAAPAAAAK
jgi:WD40 repeat protein